MKFLIVALCFVAAMAAPEWHTLSAGEVTLVQGTWAKVKSHEVEILYTIFKANPDIQAKFAAFVGKDLDSLKGTPAFIEHAHRIVGLLNRYIELIGDAANDGAIKTLLNEMGQKHAARGVTKGQFEAFKNTFVGYLKAHVDFTDSVGAAWGRAIDKMYFVVFSSLDGHPIA